MEIGILPMGKKNFKVYKHLALGVAVQPLIIFACPAFSTNPSKIRVHMLVEWVNGKQGHVNWDARAGKSLCLLLWDSLLEFLLIYGY